ncbi:MAG: hypothetical protein J1E16_12270, partial [Muribaculaceae bacterium]|nr:hypothetical protein [Muribaculaceae bacterium]
MKKYNDFNFTEITMILFSEAIQWLSGTTRDNDDKSFRNFDFFLSLLKEMRTDSGKDTKFRRSYQLDPGEAQFSEIGLADKWNLGRKKVHNLLLKMETLGLIELHNSRLGSWLTFKCVSNWRDDRE